MPLKPPLSRQAESVYKWYESYVAEEFELLESFVEEVESQSDESLARFETLKGEHKIYDGPEGGRVVCAYNGLGDECWVL